MQFIKTSGWARCSIGINFMNKHIGSNLNELLAEEDLLVESELIAIKRILAYQVEKAMLKKKLSPRLRRG